MSERHHKLIRQLNICANEVREKDDLYWEALACGQDSDQAEASGHLAGQVAGLEAALRVLEGRYDAAVATLSLDLPTDYTAVVSAYLDNKEVK